MMALVSIDSIAQAQVARITASLVVGGGVAVAGALALRLSSRISAAARCAFALLLMSSLALLVFRPVTGNELSSSKTSVIPALHLASAWARYIFFTWAAIAFAGLLRVGFAIFRVQRLKRASRRISADEIPPVVAQLLSNARRFGASIALYSSGHIRVPAAVGFFRPAVVLPEWMIGSSELSNDDLHALMLHELAHLGRWDDWANLLQKIIKAVLFFHPAVWWLDSRICAEREMACDDAVLRATGNAHDYARCLARVAEQTYVRRTLALAQAAVGHLRLTSRRVKRLLAGRVENPRGWKSVVAISSAAVVAVAGAFCRTPEFVSFSSPMVARSNSTAMEAKLPTSDLVLASAKLRPSSQLAANTQALRGKAVINRRPAVHPAIAKLPSATSPRMVHLAGAHNASYSTPKQSFLVLIESRRELPGVGVIQIESWRVVLISDAQPAHRAFPNRGI